MHILSWWHSVHACLHPLSAVICIEEKVVLLLLFIVFWGSFIIVHRLPLLARAWPSISSWQMAEDRWDTKQEGALNSQMDRKSQSLQEISVIHSISSPTKLCPPCPISVGSVFPLWVPTVLDPIRTLGAGGTDSRKSPGRYWNHAGSSGRAA